MHRHSLALRLQVLHPGLRDVEDAEAIYNINKRVLPGILEAFGRVEGGHWVAEPRYPTPEKKMPTNVVLRYTCFDTTQWRPEAEIRALCDRFFRPDDVLSFEAMSGNDDVLFRPFLGPDDDVDAHQGFLRCFVFSMARYSNVAPQFVETSREGFSLYTKDTSKWFMGPTKAAVTICDCVQSLGQLASLIPPRTARNRAAETFRDKTGIPLDEERLEAVLNIINGAATVEAWLRRAGYCEAEGLGETELHEAINKTSQNLERTWGIMNQKFQALLDTMAREGKTVSSGIHEAIASLENCLQQSNCLCDLADTEKREHQRARTFWLAGTAVSVVAIAASLLIPGSTIPACVLCGGLVGVVVCGSKAYVRWCDVDDSAQVQKQANKVASIYHNTWLFLTLIVWLQDGKLASGSEGQLTEFVNKMEETFNIKGLLENWASPKYIDTVLTNNKGMLRKDMQELMRSVKKRNVGFW